MLPVIWQNYQTLGTAKEELDALETEFRAAGGGIDLPPIGQHGENTVRQLDRPIAPDPIFPG